MLRSPRCYLHKVTVRLSFLRSIESLSWSFIFCYFCYTYDAVFGELSQHISFWLIQPIPPLCCLFLSRLTVSNFHTFAINGVRAMERRQLRSDNVCESVTTCLNGNLFLMYLIYSRRFSTKLDYSSNKSIS